MSALLNPVAELRKWSQFLKVEAQLLSKVKLAYVFGENATTGLLVTSDDEVYSIGNNRNGRLGIGSESPADSLTLVKVDALCGKNVSSFSYGYGEAGHCFALTNSGQIYSWGYNGHGLLGLGPMTTTNTFVPSIVEGLRDKRVVQLSYGWGHPLALTSEGEVFGWGYNGQVQLGNESAVEQTPFKCFKISGDIENVKISQVSSGLYHSVALSQEGQVFVWGHNGNGQLGNGSKAKLAKPVRIALPSNEQITKIACGIHHTMALAKSGKVYSWGRNCEGQLGIGTTTDSTTPILIQGLDLNDPVLDIASLNYRYHFSLCATGSKVYVWGTVSGKTNTRPMDTWLSTIQDAFWFYSKPQEVMHKAMVFDPFDLIAPTLASDIEKAFDDKTTTDVVFVSEDEKERVHVHKSILEIRSDYFRKMFRGQWKESLETSVKIDPAINYPTFHALLIFLYTDRIEFPSDDLRNTMDLLKLANRYCEMRLRERCELILKRGITIDNAVELFSTASKHNAKELQDFSYKFMLEHREQIEFGEQLTKYQLQLDDFKMLVIGLAKAK